MSGARSTEAGLRAILLGGVALGCAGLATELALTEHWESPIQLVPFVLAALGLVVSLAGLVSPAPPVRLALRVVMVGLVLGGAFGVWEHLEHNYAFEAEIRPTAPTGERAREALFGANPLLAPGALAWIGLLGLGATWRQR